MKEIKILVYEQACDCLFILCVDCGRQIALGTDDLIDRHEDLDHQVLIIDCKKDTRVLA